MKIQQTHSNYGIMFPRKGWALHRLALAINLFRQRGVENAKRVQELIDEFPLINDDFLADWVENDLFRAWLDRERKLIEDRRFSDTLVRLLGLPNGMVITEAHLDPTFFGELLDFYAA